MLPAEWRYVFKQGSIDSPRSYQLLCGPFEIDRIPKRNGSDNEVQPARAVARSGDRFADVSAASLTPPAGFAYVAQCNLVLCPVVKLRGARGFMSAHLLGVLEPPVVTST
jgi:hypothetical protein